MENDEPHCQCDKEEREMKDGVEESDEPHCQCDREEREMEDGVEENDVQSPLCPPNCGVWQLSEKRISVDPVPECIHHQGCYDAGYSTSMLVPG